MTIELTNNVVEMSMTFYDVEKVESRQYGSTEVFRFYFGKGKWSKEYLRGENICQYIKSM